MRQAIVTKYLGATNTRGSRVKATAAAGSVTLSWDDALNSEDNHTAAAHALANKYGWLENGWVLEGGGMPSEDGDVFVLVLPQVPEPQIPDTGGRPWLEPVRDAFIEGRYDIALTMIGYEFDCDLHKRAGES